MGSKWKLLTESIDAVAECQQWPIDMRTLHHPLSPVESVSGTFWPGQVNKKEFAHAHLCTDIAHTGTLLNDDLQILTNYVFSVDYEQESFYKTAITELMERILM